MRGKPQNKKRKGGMAKIGRSKRTKNQAMSSYARGKITFEQYQKKRGA